MKDYFFFPGFFTSFHVWSVLYKNAEKASSYPIHKHSLFELFYCESGSMTEWVNGVEYRLEAGDLILINSGALHRLYANEDSMFFNFHFDVEPREIHTHFQRLSRPIVSSEQPEGIKNELTRWMNRLIPLFQIEGEMQSTQKIIVQSLMLQFLSFLMEKIVLADDAPSLHTSLSKRQIANEVAYLLETHGRSESMQISELSKRLNVHRNYITNCFKQVYGISPKYYLTKVKIENAKKLLQETTMSIEDVADSLQFSSSAYFCKFFRNHVGMTPNKFRTGAGL